MIHGKKLLFAIPLLLVSPHIFSQFPKSEPGFRMSFYVQGVYPTIESKETPVNPIIIDRQFHENYAFAPVLELLDADTDWQLYPGAKAGIRVLLFSNLYVGLGLDFCLGHYGYSAQQSVAVDGETGDLYFQGSEWRWDGSITPSFNIHAFTFGFEVGVSRGFEKNYGATMTINNQNDYTVGRGFFPDGDLWLLLGANVSVHLSDWFFIMAKYTQHGVTTYRTYPDMALLPFPSRIHGFRWNSFALGVGFTFFRTQDYARQLKSLPP